MICSSKVSEAIWNEIGGLEVVVIHLLTDIR